MLRPLKPKYTRALAKRLPVRNIHSTASPKKNRYCMVCWASHRKGT